MQRRVAFLFLLVACQRAAPAGPAGWRFPPRESVVAAAHAIVVTQEPLATHVGVEVLRAGGNAVDAAVAVAFALAVTYPSAGNIGGGGFAVVRTTEGQSYALDFREVAPAGATRDMYLDAEEKPTKDSLFGARSAGVPGTVAGLWALHQKLGSKPWADLVAPSVKLAEDGIVVSETLHVSIREEGKQMQRFPASAAIYWPGGQPPPVGATLRNPDLGKTLHRIGEEGPAGFYRGETADLLVAEMERGGGIIGHADLEGYTARWREPIESDYRGYKMIQMPPPSSGGVAVSEMANILEGYDLRSLGWHSVQHLHLMAEAMRRAFADRNAYLGDPDFVRSDPALLDDGYAARRRATIDPVRATPSQDLAPGLREGSDTTHFGVVDEKGNVVALTYTINAIYGSGVTVTGAGFLLNDEMDDFAVKLGAPNHWGLTQGAANVIAPGKRPMSSMTPTIVLDRDGQVLIVTGARGGSRIINAVFQVISNIVDFDMDVWSAVSLPRIHHQHLPDKLQFEKNGLPEETRKALERRGHKLEELGLGPAGSAGVAPTILRRGGMWTAAADPRRGGAAEGY